MNPPTLEPGSLQKLGGLKFTLRVAELHPPPRLPNSTCFPSDAHNQGDSPTRPPRCHSTAAPSSLANVFPGFILVIKLLGRERYRAYEGENPQAGILEEDRDLTRLLPAPAVRCAPVSGYETPSLGYRSTLLPASPGATFDVINPATSS